MSLLKRIEGAGTAPPGGAVMPVNPGNAQVQRPASGGLGNAIAQAGGTQAPAAPAAPPSGGVAGRIPTPAAPPRQNLDSIAALRRQPDGGHDNFAELRSRVQQKLIQDIGPNADFSQAGEMRKRIQVLFDSALDTEGTQLTRADRARLFEQIVADILGYGPIQPLLDDESISEVMVNGPKQVYIERKGKLIRTDVQFVNDDHIVRIIDRIISPLGKRCDESSPYVDARLPDGSRVNIIIPPLSLVGPVVTIRKFSRNPLTTDDLIGYGTLTQEMVTFLRAAVEARLNIVVSGGTGSGKTTLLNVLSSFIPNDERIITIEDSAELQLRQEHVVTLETRGPNIEGKGAVTIRDLVRNSLRMRPERIIVGECRSGEALDMLQAMNTGHDGRLAADTSVHFGDGARRVGEYVDELLAAFPARVEHRDQHGTVVEYITVPRERAATVTCITVEGRAEATPVVYALRSRYEGELLRLRTASGIAHTVSPDHPLYALRGEVAYIPAGEVAVGDWLAAPRRILHDTPASTQDEEDSYWAGMLTGDGAISGHMGPNGRRAQYLSLAIDDAGIAEGFGEHLARTFGPDATARRYGRQDADARCHQLVCNDAGTARAVAERYALPVGARTRQMQLAWKPGARAPRHFLAGLFDAEGYVGMAEGGTRDALVLSSCNLDYLRSAREALLVEEIPARLREVQASRSASPTWQLIVTGGGAIRRFAARIPIRHARKRASLRALCERLEGVAGNPNADVIPCTEHLAKHLDTAKGLGISQRTIAAQAGISQALVSTYRRGTRLPTPGRLEALCLALTELGVACADLLLLARSDLRWERVTAIEAVPYDGYVYDLQVSETRHSGMLPHNFAADCLLTSNSMTTAHANTPRDTLSRLETMCLMAGMDLPLRAIREQISKAIEVIVQQARMKDGTRKVTHISEVQGMEGDVIIMQDIFIYEQSGVDERGRLVGRLRPTGIRPKFMEKFEAHGIYLPPSVFGLDRVF